MRTLTLQQYVQKRNGKPLLMCAMLFVLLLLFGSGNAFALACRAGNANGSILDNITMPNLSIPATMQVGTVVWRSPSYGATAVCYKDFVESSSEYVYMYINPGRITFKHNLEFGININGVDYPLQNNLITKIMLDVRVPGCPGGYPTAESCKANTQTRVDYTYYLYITKKGSTPSSGSYDTSGGNDFRYFQLDGEGGLNSRGNYALQATGLNNIRFIGCQANVYFNPPLVNLGKIVATGAVSGARAASQSSKFDMIVRSSCNEPIGVDVFFESPEALTDGNTALALPNGLNLKLKKESSYGNGPYVQFGEVESGFSDRAEGLTSKTRTYSTELYWRNQSPVLGHFHTWATVTLYYN